MTSRKLTRSMAMALARPLVPSPEYRASGGGSSGFATLDPANYDTGHLTLSNGNLTVTHAPGVSWGKVIATAAIADNSYWEVTMTAGEYISVGVANPDVTLASSLGTANAHKDAGYLTVNGTYYYGGNPVGGGSTYAPGDVIGLAFDVTLKRLHVYKNNVSQGYINMSFSTAPFHPAIAAAEEGASATANFGASAFVYTPPEGYAAGVVA